MELTRQTPQAYATQELASGRFPEMPIDCAAGSFWLCARDWRLLKGKHYGSKHEAMTARSKILDQVARKNNRAR